MIRIVHSFCCQGWHIPERSEGRATPSRSMAVIRVPSILLPLLFLSLTVGHAGAASPPELKEVGFDQRLERASACGLGIHRRHRQAGEVRRLLRREAGDPGAGLLSLPHALHAGAQRAGAGDAGYAVHCRQRFPGGYRELRPPRDPGPGSVKKKNYIAQYGRPGAAEAGTSSPAKPSAIERLTQAVGFRYVYDPVQEQYIHTSGIMILTPVGQDLAIFL